MLAFTFTKPNINNSPFIVRCSAHLLNLLCHDIIKALGAKSIVKQAGNLCGYFRRVGEENCGLARKMARMTDVRWNSVYDLLESVSANQHITSPSFLSARHCLN